MQRVETEIAGRKFVLETGKVAKQAHGAVWASYGDTVVLVTVVAAEEPKEMDFLPLTVEYQEMYYAAGRIPGSYFRREMGRGSEKEIITARLIDRPIRPLFPKKWRYETQVMATVLSMDPEVNPDIVAITAASAALELSHVPFQGPIAAVRVGRINGEFVLNPSASQLKESELNLVVVGSEEAIVMVEGLAQEVPEEVVKEALFFAHEGLKPLLRVQKELRDLAGRPKMDFPEPEVDEELRAKVRELALPHLEEVLKTPVKVERGKKRRAAFEAVIKALGADVEGREGEIKEYLEEFEKELMRKMLLEKGQRVDGRRPDEVRPIWAEVSVLPRTHGSAIFTRGETQVLTVATLGSPEEEQRIDMPGEEVFKHFILHYNFPPYCVGEVRPLRGPSRREIGHGMLAERALTPVVPKEQEFPYTIRVVSDVLESNGSSSMATVCGATLSLMDAGVPIKDMVAGIAMGLIKEGDQVVILTDILGDEDRMGDMDFKVAGTEKGVTALQMDIKIAGITREIMGEALARAREARMHVLSKMREVLDKPREKLSAYAPKMLTVKISPEKVRDLIGPGGKTIKGIIAACGDVKIDIEDQSGQVRIYSTSAETAEKAAKMVKEVTQEAEVGKLYLGKVTRVADFGAFVEIFPGTEGLIHISQLDNRRVRNVSDILKEGDEVLVKVIDIDKMGRIKLSRKAALSEAIKEVHKEDKQEDA